MKIKHTPGNWEINEEENTVSQYRIYSTLDGKNVGWFDGDDESREETDANARLIAHAPELLQMVYDLKECIKRLSQDGLTQFDRDTEAQHEGEAHELLVRINPDYYDNANKPD